MSTPIINIGILVTPVICLYLPLLLYRYSIGFLFICILNILIVLFIWLVQISYWKILAFLTFLFDKIIVDSLSGTVVLELIRIKVTFSSIVSVSTWFNFIGRIDKLWLVWYFMFYLGEILMLSISSTNFHLLIGFCIWIISFVALLKMR